MGQAIRSCWDCWRSTSWLVFRGAKFRLLGSGNPSVIFDGGEGWIRSVMVNLGLDFGLAGSMMREGTVCAGGMGHQGVKPSRVSEARGPGMRAFREGTTCACLAQSIGRRKEERGGENQNGSP